MGPPDFYLIQTGTDEKKGICGAHHNGQNRWPRKASMGTNVRFRLLASSNQQVDPRPWRNDRYQGNRNPNGWPDCEILRYRRKHCLRGAVRRRNRLISPETSFNTDKSDGNHTASGRSGIWVFTLRSSITPALAICRSDVSLIPDWL